MATFAVTGNDKLINSPFLVRKLTCTGGTASLAYTHGEDRSPDMLIGTLTAENAVLAAISITRTSATVVTLDTLVDSNTACDVYLIWFNAATGGLNPP